MAETSTDQGAQTTAGGRREQRRLLHQDLSRTQLLDAAEEVFGRKGFHETTLKEVAELAEFSVGSVYSFFASKDDLFRQIFLRRGAEFMAGSKLVFTGDDPRRELHDLVDFEVGFFRRFPRFGLLVLRYSSAPMPPDARIHPAVAEGYNESLRRQADLFRRGQASGQLGPGDPDVLARILSGIIAAYQSADPAIVSDDPAPPELLALDDLHRIVDRAFVTPLVP
ncbi:MAG: transcriptional regulator [Actinomycetia bacterium]|nr:transcriptional regulator [Actinomycetes bacterium]